MGSSSSSRLRERNTVEDRAQIRGYAQQYLKQIVHVLSTVPPPMLLLFKTNDCLRHAERTLDAGVDSFLITLRHCLQAKLRGDKPGGARAMDERRAWSLSAVLQRARLRIAEWLVALVVSQGHGRWLVALVS